MTKIVAHMVVKNEEDKYLQSCLEWNSQWWDEIFFYDDMSTDSTVEMCKEYGVVETRPEHVPSFVENEGAFRQAAWDSMAQHSSLSLGDYVFSLDADEFLVGTVGRWNPRDGLLVLIDSCEQLGFKSAMIPVPEVWNHLMVPYVRVDGFWADNKNERFVKYDDKGAFRDGMGCGSVPESNRKVLKNLYTVALLHYGYTIPGAVQSKFDRYIDSPGRHNIKHVRSIVEEPELAEWKGEVPKLWLGRR